MNKLYNQNRVPIIMSVIIYTFPNYLETCWEAAIVYVEAKTDGKVQIDLLKAY